MIGKFRLATAISSVFLLLFLTACGSGTSKTTGNTPTKSENASDANGKEVTISYSFWGDPKTKSLHEAVVEAFMKKHPNIKVEKVHVADGNTYIQKIQTLMAGGQAPDVINLVHNDLRTFAAKAVLTDVSDWVKRDWDSAGLSDNRKEFMDIMQLNGKYYGLPRNASGWYIYYNKDLFDKAGVKYPDASWTWDSFLEASKKLANNSTDPNQRVYATAIDGKDYNQSINWIWQAGGDLFSQDQKNFLIDTPEDKKGLEFIHDLIYKYKVAPEPSVLASTKAQDLFAAGKVAMVMDTGVQISSWQSIKNFKWDIALLPKGPGDNRIGRMGPTGLVIPKTSKNKEAAWELVKFINGPEAQEILCSSGYSAPVRTSILHDEKKFLPRDKFAINRDVAIEGYEKNSRLVPTNVNWTKIETTLRKYLDLYYVNSMSLDDATKKIQEEVTPLLK